MCVSGMPICPVYRCTLASPLVPVAEPCIDISGVAVSGPLPSAMGENHLTSIRGKAGRGISLLLSLSG